MGSCVSSHNTKTMKNNKSDKNHDDDVMMIPPSPIKDENVAVKHQWLPLHSSANSRDFRSKEETFFDSQAWLDSDCESDFMSVNGDFTPSRGNTPVHHNFSTGTPLIKGGEPTVDDQKLSMTTQSPTPVKKKKRLSDLFSESLRENHYNNDDDEPTKDNEKSGRVKATAVHGGGLKPKKERWVEIVHVNGCLPRALSSCRPVSTQHTEGRKK